MLHNYFKVLFRNLWKNKAFTGINLLGLASGMAICFLLVLYIQSELGYDSFHANGDRLYRLTMERKYPGRSAFRAGIPHSVGPAAKAEFPGVLEVTHVGAGGSNGSRVESGEKVFTKERVLTVDSNFFSLFTGDFVEGDANALQKPGTAVVTESAATRYFGSATAAMGKKIVIDESAPYIISGVCRDWPAKSHLSFDVLESGSGNEYMSRPDFVYFGPYTYLLLDRNASAASLQAMLPGLVEKYVAPAVPGVFGESWKQFTAEGNDYKYSIMPVKDIHLYSTFEDEPSPPGSMRNLIILGSIAAFILLLACVNFVNLSTALAVQRAKEVGVRKTFGSRRTHLIRQFLTESLIFSFCGLLIAIVMAALFVPALNSIVGGQLSITWFFHPLRLLAMLAFSVFVGLLAGLYPAFVLSSFDPIEVLKGRFKTSRRGIVLRNGLVVFQFAISVILIICTIVVNLQMQYVLGDSLGFRQDAVVSVEALYHLRNGRSVDQRQAFIDDLANVAGVKDVSRCNDLPGSDEQAGGATFICIDTRANRTDHILQADASYQKLLDLQLKQGRFFSNQMATDSLAVVLNEEAVADFGLKNPIGAQFVSNEPGYDSTGKRQNRFTVIGVVKDFHYQSLRKKLAPLIITNAAKFGYGTAAFRINGEQFGNTVAQIGALWHKMDPKHDLRLNFLDQQLGALYKAERTEQKIFTLFSSLAILIACIGLLGLSTYAVRQRTKELSIRKVLGAVPGNIIFLLSKDFLILIGVAALIAFPLSWLAMNTWLQNFAYRVDISWWIFVLAGSLAVLIAMVTISYQAIRAAISNPINGLRSE